jgi:ABC-type amino acid transport system permease subunit
MPRWLAHTIVAAVFAGAIAAAFWRAGYAWNWSAVWDYRQKFLEGWLVTVALSIAALAASIAVGAAASAPQLTRTKGPVPRLDSSWIALAISSLPVPVSPSRSTEAFDAATRRVVA